MTINAQQVNAIIHMIPIDSLIFLTSSAEWSLTGAGGIFDPITPSSISIRPQGFRGCTDVLPIIVGHNILYVQRNGVAIREMEYNLYFGLYITNDVSLFARHLFENYTVREWAFQQDPNYIVWTRAKRRRFARVYLCQGAAGFRVAHHITQGQFLSVAVTDEGLGQDEVYFCVQRTLAGNPVYYIEKLCHRPFLDSDLLNAVFLDASLSYNGAPLTVFGGLQHLEGMTVNALADGNPVIGLIVTGGQVTLPNAASVVTVGLAYTSSLQTMKGGSGTAAAKRRTGTTRKNPRASSPV